MQVKIKRLHPDAVIPTYAKAGDAGMDLVAISMTHMEQYLAYKTGLSVEIPTGFVGLIFPRSSVSNYNLCLANCVGVIDSGYRGEIEVRFKPTMDNRGVIVTKPITIYKTGDKVAQLIILPHPLVEFEEVEELATSERGTGGYGSTGK